MPGVSVGIEGVPGRFTGLSGELKGDFRGFQKEFEGLHWNARELQGRFRIKLLLLEWLRL